MKPADRKTEYSRALRSNLTDAEQFLWRHLRGRQLEGCKFRRQHPLGPYIVDFVCLEKKLVVELDGGQHALNVAYDLHRDTWLKENGYSTLRFWNDDVFKNSDGVLEVIQRNLSGMAVVSPSP